MEHRCPYCGAMLPEDAAFCPHCARSVNRRAGTKELRTAPRWVFWLIAALAVLAVACAALLLLNRPRTYEGQGEVVYTAGGTSYRLVLGEPDNPYQPLGTDETNAEIQMEYRVNSRLYIFYSGSDENAAQAFLAQTDAVSTQLLLLEGEGTASCTQPEPRTDVDAQSALMTFIDYTVQGDLRIPLLWTFEMKNGDTIQLRQDLVINAVSTWDYYPEDADMSTTQALQALLDRLSDMAAPEDVVNLHLPAVTYDGLLVVASRPINFYGSAQGEQRTTFTGPVRLDYKAGQYISYFYDIDFRGGSEGVGLSTASRVWAEGCTFTGWKTGFLGYGSAWVNAIGCTFADNEVGFHFNSDGDYVSHSMYNDNVFRDNGTAVLLERVPSDVALNFQGSIFAGNGTDIDNRCGQPVDVSQAVFEPAE